MNRLVDGRLSVADAHRIMDEVEARIADEFPGVEVLIHPDPFGHLDGDGIGSQELLPTGRTEA